MKIGYVTPSYHPAYIYGGPTYSALGLSTALARGGCDVRVLTTDANGRDRTLEVDTTSEVELEPRLRVRYCHRVAVDSVSPAFLRELRPLVEWADVVHLTAVYNFSTLPTLFAAKGRGKPLVWTPRGGLLRWEGSRRPAMKQGWETLCRVLMPPRAALHATSQREADQSRARFPNLPVFVIPNGVDIPAPSPKEESTTLRLLSLGRLDPIKGLENLFLALAKVGRRGSSAWRLVVAGDGAPAYVESLRAQTARLRIAENVNFVGHVEPWEKSGLFAQTDVLVAASHSENFGMVIAEALARAVPVIVSRGTPWSGVEQVGCGLWVDNDPESLCNAIERMRDLPLADMGKRGRAWMQDEYSWAHVAERMMQTYKGL